MESFFLYYFVGGVLIVSKVSPDKERQQQDEQDERKITMTKWWETLCCPSVRDSICMGKKRLDIYVYYSTYCTAIIVVHDFSCPYIVKDALLYMGKQSFLFLFIEFIVYWGGCCSRKILLHVCDCYFIKKRIRRRKNVCFSGLLGGVSGSEYRRVMDWRTSLLFFFLPLFQRKVPDLFLFFNFFFFFWKTRHDGKLFLLSQSQSEKMVE